MTTSNKTSLKVKNQLDGMIFKTKIDLKYYINLKSLKDSNFISDFSLEASLDEKDNLFKYHTKTVEIDGKAFNSKADADYYLFLKDHLLKGHIQNFSLDLIQKKSYEKAKYFAKKVEIDNQIFDSKDEANYYLYLLELKRTKQILGFTPQPAFELQPGFKKNGVTFKPIKYIADFEVYLPNGEIDVVDVKGMITPDFALKRKMFEYKYIDRTLKLMKFVSKYGGWITHEEWKRLVKESKKNK